MKKDRILSKYESWGGQFISMDRFTDILHEDLGRGR
jgi:hypothetical protein